MRRLFNPFYAALDVFGSRKMPLLPIPSSSNARYPGAKVVDVYQLFKGTPPFFARYALVLLSLNIMVTGNLVYECMSGGELYFNPFSNHNRSQETRDQITSSSSNANTPPSSSSTPTSTSTSTAAATSPSPPSPSISTSTSPSSSPTPTPTPSTQTQKSTSVENSPSPSSSSSPQPQTQIQPQIQIQTLTETPPKPFWRRVSFAAFHLGLGGCIAAFLLSQRARSLRSITIVRSYPSSSSSSSSSSKHKPKSKPKTTTVYLQASGHPRGHAYAFPLDTCALAPTKMNKDLVVIRTRDAGKFFFVPGARGSVVGGRDIAWMGAGMDARTEREARAAAEAEAEAEAESQDDVKDTEKRAMTTNTTYTPANWTQRLAKLNVLKVWRELGGKVERIAQQ